MSDSASTDERAPASNGGRRIAVPEALRPDAKRLRALRAAWIAAANCCPKDLAREISASEVAARQDFKRLATLPGGPDGDDVLRLGISIDVVQHSVCRAVFEVPVERLEAVLPGRLAQQEKGLLDLLDLLVADAFQSPAALASKLPAIDYLITLLCTGGDSQRCVAPRDPVELTPAFQELCRRAEAECEVALSELEAEFFTAANLATDVGDPEELRALRERKAKLGRAYFAPGMLRAIVTYNMALLQARQPWTCDRPDEAIGAPPASAPVEARSVFESEALIGLLTALKRRLVNGVVQPDPLHRIAWALDLETLRGDELETLREGRLDPSDLHTCIVLLGLLCRSLNVLAIELQGVGIDPEHVSGNWVEEVDQLIKLEVNNSLKSANAESAYAKARELSALRNRFLYTPGKRRDRTNGDRAAAAAAAVSEREEQQVRREARALASEAMTGEKTSGADRAERSASPRKGSLRTVLSGAVATLLVLTLALHLFGVIDLMGRNLDRWSDAELASVSEHLVQGHRNGGGAGTAFVGKLDEEWPSLPLAERERIARQLVSSLRSRGIAQVMIYDSDDRLRIQALGETIRTL